MKPKQRRPMGLDDKFKRGQYAGQHLWAVIERDPSYVHNLIESIDFEIDNEAYGKLNQLHTGRGAISVTRREVRL